MVVDYHTHTKWCCHASGEMADYVEAAIEKGFDEIGFAAHMPWMPERRLKLALTYEEVELYVAEAKRLADEYRNDIIVRMGAEADYVPGQEDHIGTYLRQYDFDYVMGSIHYIGEWGYDQQYDEEYAKWNRLELHRAYFGLIEAAARSGLFNIVGHLDLLKKFGVWPEGDQEPYEAIFAKTLGAVKEAGVCVEINTVGLVRPCEEIFPSLALLKQCRELDIPLTLGSDAHSPEDVGRQFDKGLAHARAAGYDTITRFSKREAEPVELG